MNSGGGSDGRDPDPSSPSSSSFSGPTRLGFDPTRSQHQQLQQSSRSQQQHQQGKPEGNNTVAYTHGVTAVSNFASPSSGIPMSQLKFNELRQDNQNKGQVPEHLQSQFQQAYLQFAMQNAQQQQKPHGSIMMQQHQAKFGIVGPNTRDQDMRANNLKMHEMISMQAASQPQIPMFQKPGEQFGHERKSELGNTSTFQKPEMKLPHQAISMNSVRPVQGSMENSTNHQFLVAQFQAWAMENNIDLSHPGNANLVAKLWPVWQSSRSAAMQKKTEVGNSSVPPPPKQVTSSPVGSETSAHGSPSTDLHGQVMQAKSQQSLPFGPTSSVGSASIVNVKPSNSHLQHQPALLNRDGPNDRVVRPPVMVAGGQLMRPVSMDQLILTNKQPVSEALQAQNLRSLPQSIHSQSQPSVPSDESTGPHQVSKPIGCFTDEQLHVLKAQILAFRRIKRGEGALPQEVLQAIIPPPLNSEQQKVIPSPGTANQESSVGRKLDENTEHGPSNTRVVQVAPPGKLHGRPKEEPLTGEQKLSTNLSKQPLPASSIAKIEGSILNGIKAECDLERDGPSIPIKSDSNVVIGKEIPTHSAVTETSHPKKPATSSSIPISKDAQTRRYQGPLFDFPYFTRKPDNVGTSAATNTSNLMLGYDVKDLLYEEGRYVLKRKKTENIKKINRLLAINLERKRIRADLVTKLKIEERKYHLLDIQARLKDEVEQHQQEIMTMPDRAYRTFVRQCERQRLELSRQVQQLQKSIREKQLKSMFNWRKKLSESHNVIRDSRTARNRGIAKYHERMLREFSKMDDGRNKRMEALKNNDVDRYREMLLEQQTSVPGDAAQRYSVLSSFLSQTEEYLNKLGGKITATKNHQEVEEAAKFAAAAARDQGLSEEEVKAAAACAREEVTIRNTFSEMNAPRDSVSASVNKYYNLAHALNEKVVRQPSMLRAGTLRDYQLVGLQWMLSLYNNKLNGILADEMGLGKTVQVMALIAYLMEFKGNYGPHLIIVPNAVLVNWKSELHNWLPSVSCIFYVGNKDQRSRLFSQEVLAKKYNVLVTTYEFVMYDRPKLSRIEWKYIIIDEAQRMKDRESVLARDLDRYRCQRRLLLTGTPLQNDLKELWSLLNLLLPEIFDNKKAFNDWFSKPFQKDGPSQDSEEDDWLETEKKVIIIHRLHQILEPFMLRRRVEDVEGSLPRKVSIVLRCRMSAVQGAIYDWIKSTGTIRVDPEDELRRVQKNPNYQAKIYKNLNNKCMELRKACNHPLLNYPYFSDYSKDFLVRSCGKLWILDRVLLKLHRAGHRVLLFSTMTKLLDILEEYLQWRQLVYRRIDGTTSLEDRESAIVDFNTPDTDCFIFLLSIRAAGRGLNLQTADTVVIYDPDSNPQNEEQAVARAHRIGQKREVKVIYMEAVVDKLSSCQKEDELRAGNMIESDDDDLAGKDRYMGSIESLIRSNIQQYKIDMADEVINAGRFDQRTTHEERRMTLETLLHDEERYQETVHNVPSLQEVNRMIARSEEEIELFDQMDEDFDWTGDLMNHSQVPMWLRAGSRELNAAVNKLSKKKSKSTLDQSDIFSGLSPTTSERKIRPRARTNYKEVDDDDSENSDTSSVERNPSYLQEEDEMEEHEDEDFKDERPSNKDKLDEDLVLDEGNYEFSHIVEGSRSGHVFEEAASPGSSTGSRRLRQPITPSISLQKFGSLSAIEVKPKGSSKKLLDELEEGEIGVSGDYDTDLQQFNWNHDLDVNKDEQVIQPKIKGKRSTRFHPRCTVERIEEKSMHIDQDHDMQSCTGSELGNFTEPFIERQLSNQQQRGASQNNVRKPGRLSSFSGLAEDTADRCRGNLNGKANSSGGTSFPGKKMSESTHKKCKNVVSKLQRKISKDGYEIAPVLYDLWERNEHSSLPNPAAMMGNTLDLQRIEQRVENLEYNGVTDFITDVQLLLQNVVQYYNYSYEVKHQARKIHDIFFDFMKIAFPDKDFRMARNSFTFPSHGSSQSKQHKSIKPSPPQEVKITMPSKLQKDPNVANRTLTHPGDLVTCKKKRRDRRAGPTSSSPDRASPAGQPSAAETAQWAKPVKKMRTDTGKRRPSQL